MSSTMNSPPLQTTDDTRKLTGLGTRVQSFLRRATDIQWDLLKSCTSNESTRMEMFGLHLHVDNALSNVFLTPTWRSIFSKNDSQVNPGIPIVESGDLQVDTADEPKDMFVEVVMEKLFYAAFNCPPAPEETPEETPEAAPEAAPEATPLQRFRNLFPAVRLRRHRVGVMEDPADAEKTIEPRAIPPVFVFEDVKLDTTDETEGGENLSISETFLGIVIEKLFTRILKKARCGDINNSKDILRRLYERTWAKVEGVDVEPTQKNLHKLDKIIFKDLCKQLGHADQVVLSLIVEDEVIVNSIVAAFNCCAAPKVTLLQRIRKLFPAVYRRRHRVGVMDTADETEGGEHLSILESIPTADERKQAFLRIVIQKVFTRIAKEAKCFAIEDDGDIFQRCYKRTWAIVRDVDFELTQKNLLNLDKIIYKDLYKQLGDPALVMLSLRLEHKAIVTSIAYALKPKPIRQPFCNFIMFISGWPGDPVSFQSSV